MNTRLLAALATGLLAVGCATLETGHDFEPDAPFSEYHSFGILSAPTRESPIDDPRFGPLLDRHTEAAIGRVLSSRGYALRSEGPVDFLVAYRNEVRVEERVDSSPVSVGLGYGTIVSGVGIGTGWRAPLHVRARTVTRGRLVIDVVEPAGERLVWRGWAEDTLRGRGDLRDRIARAVERVLARFPPSAD